MTDTARDVIARDQLVDFLVQYGGRCRDCADEDGFCPQTGIGCGQRRKAVEFVLGALEYGSKHGFAAGFRVLAPGELDGETAELRASLVAAQKRMEAIRDYPKEGDGRRDEDGYPLEIVYDEFAYRRMVDSYRAVAVDYLAALLKAKEAQDG